MNAGLYPDLYRIVKVPPHILSDLNGYQMMWSKNSNMYSHVIIIFSYDSKHVQLYSQ